MPGAGKHLADQNALGSYNVTECSTLHPTGTLWGSCSSFCSVDLSSPTIKRNGVSSSTIKGLGVINRGAPNWMSFSEGLNLIGTCPNQHCVSNTSGIGEVITQEGTGLQIFTPDKNLVSCPACNEEKFTPNNFRVNFARSLFTYKKVGEGAKQRLLECQGYLDYVEFNPKGSGRSNYDLIEIRTVGPNGSLFTCVCCGKKIKRRENEFVMNELRVYHRSCYSRRRRSSFYNNVPCWSEEYNEFKKLFESFFGELKKWKGDFYPWSRFLGDVGVAFWSKEETDSEKQLLLKAEDWHRKAIKDNLTKLMKNTICDIPLLNFLLQNNAISSSEKHSLEIIQNKNERATKLYELIPSRTNGFVVLIEALQENNQTVAAELLLIELCKHDRPTWEKIVKK